MPGNYVSTLRVIVRICSNPALGNFINIFLRNFDHFVDFQGITVVKVHQILRWNLKVFLWESNIADTNYCDTLPRRNHGKRFTGYWSFWHWHSGSRGWLSRPGCLSFPLSVLASLIIHIAWPAWCQPDLGQHTRLLLTEHLGVNLVELG